VQRKAPQLAWVVDTMYGAAKTGLTFTPAGGEKRTETVERGVLPGDPVGTIIMCMVLHDKMGAHLAEEFADVITVIFADDHHSLLPLARMGPFLDRFEQLLARCGCKTNSAKSKAMLIGGGDADKQRFLAEAGARGVTVVEGGMEVTGYPVGTREYRVAWANELAAKVANEQRALARTLATAYVEVPRHQALAAAVRQTASASFLWAARGLDPTITAAAAEQLDNAICTLIYEELNMSEARARLPERDQRYADARLKLAKVSGGAAFARCQQSIAGAYLGGVVDLARALKRHHPLFNISRLLPGADALYADVCDRAKKVASKDKINIYSDVGELAENRPGKAVHHAVAKVYDAELFDALIKAHGQSPRTASLIASAGKASAVLDASPRWIPTRLNNAEYRCGLAAMLGLPLTEHGLTNTCQCGARNDATGEHAPLCRFDNAKQPQATAGQVATGLIIEQLRPRVRLRGKPLLTNKVRPTEFSFKHAADSVGIVLTDPAADADKRFDVTFEAPDGALHYVDAKRTAHLNTNNLAKVCNVKHGQGYAVEQGEKTKIASYHKVISNLDSKSDRIHFATVDTAGNLSKGYDKLIKLVCRMAYPGAGADGRYDVDGLRSRAVAFARQTVGVGVWRSNFITISAWAARTYGPAPCM